MSQKKVAVIILNWNGEALLKRYLPSVIANTNSELADVIVADNGSTDGSRQLIGNMPHTLLFDKNYGFAEGYNRALDMTDYEYTVLLNSDVRTPEGWLEPLVEYCDAHPEVGAVQPKLLQDRDDNLEMFEYAGAAGGFIDCHGFPYCKGRIFASIENDHGQYDGEPQKIFWASGAAFMVRSAIYKKAGGLDKYFFAHMEEIDLCWRIHRLGYDIAMVPQSHVYHLGGGSLPQGNPRKTYLNFRNNLLLLYKNVPLKEGRRLLVVRRLYDTAALMVEVLKGNFANAKAIFKAHIDYRKMKQRYTDQPSENLLKQTPEGRCNIIFDYYLRGRKKF